MDLRIPEVPEPRMAGDNPLDFVLLVPSADLIKIGPPLVLRRPAPRVARVARWRPWARRCRQALVACRGRTKTPNRGKWLDRP